MELTHLFEDDTLTITAWQNLVGIEVAGELQREHVQRIETAYRRRLVQFPAGIQAACFVQAEVPLASAEVRAEFNRSLKDLGPRVQPITVILEARGALVIALKTIIRGINMVTRNNSIVMCEDIREMARALLPQMIAAPGTTMNDAALQDLLRRMRRTNTARRASVASMS